MEHKLVIEYQNQTDDFIINNYVRVNQQTNILKHSWAPL